MSQPMYSQAVHGHTYQFANLAEVLAKATPKRSGDELAGCAAQSAAERAAAQWVLADVPLSDLVSNQILPYEDDVVTRIILDDLDTDGFGRIASMTVGEFREWLLTVAYREDAAEIFTNLHRALTPEVVAAVSKLMSNGELIAVSSAIVVTKAFRTTVGLPGRLATRLQPNHPADDAIGVAAAVIDGLSLGAGDAVIGINPATDSPQRVRYLLDLIDEIRLRYEIPTQSCVLTHVSSTIDLMEQGAPVDLVFQSIAGTEGTLKSFGVTPSMLAEAKQAADELGRGTVGTNTMYFETGQGSCLSANAHLTKSGQPLDQQTLEARAYGLARRYDPFLINTVVGFIGPEYLYDGKQIIRAGLEDLFCGKLLGLNMGVDVCYTNHAEADGDDMDTLLHLLIQAAAGFVITVPGADDIMLGYQSLSYHDVATARAVTGRKHAPEFEQWLASREIIGSSGHLLDARGFAADDLATLAGSSGAAVGSASEPEALRG